MCVELHLIKGAPWTLFCNSEAPGVVCILMRGSCRWRDDNDSSPLREHGEHGWNGSGRPSPFPPGVLLCRLWGEDAHFDVISKRGCFSAFVFLPTYCQSIMISSEIRRRKKSVINHSLIESWEGFAVYLYHWKLIYLCACCRDVQ